MAYPAQNRGFIKFNAILKLHIFLGTCSEIWTEWSELVLMKNQRDESPTLNVLTFCDTYHYRHPNQLLFALPPTLWISFILPNAKPTDCVLVYRSLRSHLLFYGRISTSLHAKSYLSPHTLKPITASGRKIRKYIYRKIHNITILTVEKLTKRF